MANSHSSSLHPLRPKIPFWCLATCGELLTDSSSTQNHLLLTNHINCLSCLDRHNGHINLCIWGFWILSLFLLFWGILVIISSSSSSFAFLLYIHEIKGIFHPKLPLSCIHPHAVSNLCDLLSFKEPKEEVLKKVHAAYFQRMKA